MEESRVTIKVYESTRQKLRLLAALTGQNLQKAAEEAVNEKLDRVKAEQEKKD